MRSVETNRIAFQPEERSKGTDSSSARRRGSLDLDEECVPAIIFGSGGHLIKALRYVVGIILLVLRAPKIHCV